MYKTLILLLLTMASSQFSFGAEDPLVPIVQNEIQRQMEGLKDEKVPPYFMSYTIKDYQVFYTVASFGSTSATNSIHKRDVSAIVKVGSYHLDNTHKKSGGRAIIGSLPLDDDTLVIQQVLWNKGMKSYATAISQYASIKRKLAASVEEEDQSDDFSKIETPNTFIEKKIAMDDMGLNQDLLSDKAKRYSALFRSNTELLQGEVAIFIKNERRYFFDSEGNTIAQNHPKVNIQVKAQIKADDGMLLPMYLSYFAYHVNDMPDDVSIETDIKEMIEKLNIIKDASVVDPYAGPAIFSGDASGVFFHEIFGHRIEGARLKKESDGQTFKKKIGENVLNKSFSVVSDPTIKEYNGQAIEGYYQYDDEGMLAQKVDVVEDGTLNEFLMSRSPIEGAYASNGHGRSSFGYNPAARQSNLIVTCNKILSEEELRKKLRKEMNKQDLEYAFYFKRVSGGFTQTGRYSPNSFNITPTEVYKVYADDRPDEMVRGIRLVGTPLSMFSGIVAGGGDYGIFNGQCGAESGSVPVSAISPMIMVNKIELQKAPKSTNKPKVLPAPTASIQE